MSDPGAARDQRPEPPASPASLRIAVVGPTHPFKGGVAAHTTSLAHALAEAGHDVTLVSWTHLYPSLLYPGEQRVPDSAPDVPPFPRTERLLSWARPDTWVRAGRSLRDVDAVVLVHVVPVLAAAHLTLLRALGRRGPGSGVHGPRTLLVAHNVLPHEARAGDRRLVGALLRRCDAVLVHSGDQARLASALGAHRVVELELPPHLPGGPPECRARPPAAGPVRVLALGIVRDYKGVDLLLEAAAEVPGVHVTVAGELWGDAGRRVSDLAALPRLAGRVDVRGGYVPAGQVAGLLAGHDVLALTYRNATASQNVLLARHHGLPVLATDVGTFSAQVRDGVDGLLVPPGDPEALVAALARLAEPGYAAGLRDAVTPPDLAGPWARYVGTIEALSSREASATAEPGDPASGRPARTRHRPRTPHRSHRSRRRPPARLDVRPGDLPERVRATDVLAVDADAVDARDQARALGLPRAAEPVSAWAALGALAAVVRIRDDGRRSAVVVDESGPASPLSPWLAAIGFAPVELDLTAEVGASVDVDAGSLDVVTRVHPGGCSAEDVDHALAQAAWALRPGGLLVLTLPVGDDDPRWAVRPADVRGVLARADDQGLLLVGDLDGDLTGRMRHAARQAAAAGGGAPAYAILRLTFRKR